MSNSLGPKELLETMPAEPEDAARFTILSTVAEIYEEDLPRAAKKALYVRLAAGLVVISVVLIIVARTTMG